MDESPNSGPPHEWPFELFDPRRFEMPKRTIDNVVIDNTGWDSISYAGTLLAEEINKWHMSGGWHGIAYHFVIDKWGNIVKARGIEESPVVHKGKANGQSIAIVVQGLWHFTEIEMASVYALCTAIDDVFTLAKKPITFHGLSEYVGIPSPMFDYRSLLGLSDNGMMHSSPTLTAGVVAQEATRFQPLGTQV